MKALIAELSQHQLESILESFNMPQGTKVQSFWIDRRVVDNESVSVLCMRVEHDSFEEVKSGAKIPVVEVKRKMPVAIAGKRKAAS